jgi:hypothetical protein
VGSAPEAGGTASGGTTSGPVSGSGGHSGVGTSTGGWKSLPPVVGGTSGTTPIGGTGGTSSTGGTAGEDDPGPGGRPSCDTERVVLGTLNVRTQAELDPFEGVTKVEGSLIVELDISNLEPLSCLETVTGDLVFGDPYSLHSLSHLEYLRTVGGDLILEATLVPDIQTLSGLGQVGGSVRIIYNLHLERLVGLDGLLSVGENLVIEGNDRVAQCEGEWLVSAIGRDNIAGYTSIAGNKGTCRR